MSNDYFERINEFSPHTTARGQEVSSEFDSVQTGFEKLPAPRLDGESKGFTSPFTILTPTEDQHPATNLQLQTEKGRNNQQDARLDNLENFVGGVGDFSERYATLRYIGTTGQLIIIVPAQFESVAYVHKNGLRLYQTVDFAYNKDTRTIAFAEALTQGDVILVDVGLVPDALLLDLLALQEDVAENTQLTLAARQDVEQRQQDIIERQTDVTQKQQQVSLDTQTTVNAKNETLAAKQETFEARDETKLIAESFASASRWDTSLGLWEVGKEVSSVNQLLEFDGGMYAASSGNTFPFFIDGNTPNADSHEWFLKFDDSDLHHVAIANNVGFDEVAYLQLGPVSGVNYFWDVSTQHSYRANNPVSDSISSYLLPFESYNYGSLITESGAAYDLSRDKNPLLNLSPIYAAMLSRIGSKPTVKPIFDQVLREIKCNETYRIPTQAYGFPGGIVLKKPSIITSYSTTEYRSEMVVLTPVSELESFSFSVSVSDTAGLEVSVYGSNVLDGSGTVVSGLTADDNSYSFSSVASGNYSYIGLRFRYSGENETVQISDLEMITVNNELDFEDVANNHHSSIIVSRTLEIVSMVEDSFGAFSFFHFGVGSGLTNNVIYCSPDATPVVDTGSTITRRAKGLTIDNPATINTALVIGQQMFMNGLSRPKILLLNGTYDADVDGVNAAIRGDYISGDDCYILAPYGDANITSSGESLYGLFSLSDYSDGATLYMYGLNFDSIENPVKAQYLNVVAYKCTTNSGVEGWDIDDCNATLQECWAETATNDGFNSHGTGHTCLIDCYAYNNGDDGFSPHDQVTFEVWGGQYGSNGKGNVIPAFGAQGFCVGVSSREDKKSSDRIDGENYGGFVCLSGNEASDNTYRQTILLLVDCVSYKDNLGVNSSGYKSTVIMSNNRISAANEVKINQGEWQTNGHGCIIEIDNQDLAGTGTDRVISNEMRYNRVNPFVGSSDT